MRLIAAALLILAALCAGPAAAQLAAQQTYIPTSTGSANAIAISVANISTLAQLKGVPLRVLMNSTNTAAATLSVNGLTATAVSKPTTSGLAPLSGGEIFTGQINTFIYDGSVFELAAPSLFFGTVPVQNGFAVPINLSLSCTATSNVLTCAMLSAQTGSAPTSSSPIYIPFRDATIATGDPVWRTITTGNSFSINGGNTMGCVSSKPCRLWLFAADNAGTVEVCAYNALSGVNVVPINEGNVVSSGTGTGGGSTAQQIFCNGQITSKAVRYIGYVEYTTLTTAGNWTTPSFVQLFGPGIKRPGDLVQQIYNSTASTTNCSSTTLTVETAINASITPTSAANVIDISAQISQALTNTAGNTIYQLSRGTSPTLIGQPATTASGTGTSGSINPIALIAMDAPATTSAQVYAAYCATTSTFTDHGGVIILREIMGANDNVPTFLARKVG